MTANESRHPKEGSKVPEVQLQVVEHGEARRVDTAALFAGKSVVLFALPGAFTPTCSSQHLPRYEELAPTFREHQVDTLMCLSVNDSFVMAEWGKDQGVTEIMLVADGNGAFSDAMGLLIDGSANNMGRRSKRYSMFVRDGVIEKMFVEPDAPGDPYGLSDADTMLNYLAPGLKPAPHIAILTKPGCPFCASAKAMLNEHGLRYVEIPMADATRGRALQAITGDKRAPQIFIDAKLIGGSDALQKYFETGGHTVSAGTTA